MNPEEQLCLFRQFQIIGQCDVPPEDVIAAFTAPHEFTCRVGTCAIRGAELLACVYDFERNLTEQEIKEITGPACSFPELFLQ